MANYDGSIRINTKVDTGEAKNNINSLGSTVKKLGGIIASAFAITKLVQFGKSAINLASDLQEAQNVVDVAFGSMSDKANAFAQSALKNYGLAELSAKKYSSTFMSMAKGMGLATDDATNMSLALTGLVGDVSSFYNIEQDLAATKLKGIFTGESEALKDLGVVMTEANLEAYALAKGFNKSMKEMTQAEKVALRYQYVTEQLSLAQGDFSRTSDSWANQIRVLKETFNSLSSIIGEFLIKGLTPFVQKLNDILQRLLAIAQAAKSLFLVSDAAEEITDTATDAAGAQEEVTEAVEGTGEAIAGNLASFDELNVMNDESTGGGDASNVFDGLPTDEDTKVEIGEGSTVSPDLTNALLKIKEILEPIISLILTLRELVGTGLKKAFEVLSPIIEGLLALLKQLLGIFGDFAGSVKDMQSVEEFFSGLIDTVEQAATAIIETLAELIPQLVQIVADIVVALVKAITSNVPKLLNSVVNIVKKLLEALTEMIPQLLNTVKDLALSLMNELVNGLLSSESMGALASAVGEIIAALLEFVVENLPLIVESAVEIVVALVQGLLEALPHLIEGVLTLIITIVETIVENLPEIISMGLEIVGSLIAGLLEAIPSLIAAIPKLIFAIIDTIFSTNWLQVGIDIIKGIGQGLVDGVKSIGSKIGDACKGIWKTVKGWFGINSPSKKMRETVGPHIATGVGAGFEDEIAGVGDDMEQALADEFDDAWGRVTADLSGAKLPSVNVNEMLPVSVSHELIKNEDGDVFAEIRDRVENIASDVEQIRKNGGQSPTTTGGGGGITTRASTTISASRENRKAGKTIYPVGN